MGNGGRRARWPLPTRVTDGPAADTSPSWSPDGRRLVFWSHLAGTSRLTVVDADGRNRVELPVHTQPDGPHRVFPPAWSPDGRWVLFESNRDAPPGKAQTDLYLVRPDGRDLRRLTTDAVLTAAPSWTPDGRGILYSQQFGDPARPFPDLYARGVAQGSPVRRITSDDFHDWHARWSPDGRSFAWMSNRNPGNERGAPFRVHVRSASGAVRLLTPTTGAATAESPAWTPDGRSIVYALDPDGPLAVSAGYFGGTDLRVFPGGPLPARLRVVGADGRGDRALTSGGSNAITPAVQPVRR